MLIVDLLDGTEARFNPDAGSVLARGEGWTLYRSRTGRLVLVEVHGDETTAYEIREDDLLDWAEDATWLSTEMQEEVAAARSELPEI